MTAVDPSIKLQVHDYKGCGGIAVVVPSSSVNGGSVVYCLKCMEDEIEEKDKTLEELRQRPTEDRFTLLARHWHNEKLANLKLRAALEGILKVCTSDDHSDAGMMVMNVEALAKAALSGPRPPSIGSTWDPDDVFSVPESSWERREP